MNANSAESGKGSPCLSQIDNDPARVNSQEKPQFIKTQQSAVFLKATSGMRPTTTFHEEGH